MLGGGYYLANHLRASQSARQKHYSLVWYIQIIITIIIILIVIIIIIGWIHKHNFEQYQSSFIHSYPQFKYMSNSCIIVVYLHIYGLVIDSHNDLLPVGLRAQLVEHCTGIAEVRICFGFPRVLMFPLASSRDISGLSGKRN